MTREEKQKAIDVLKISAPVITVTQKEFEDYIQTLNKIMDWLEQEPCEDAISRKDVLFAVRVGMLSTATVYGRSEEGMAARREIEDALRMLPPVKPIEKVGRWIADVDKWGDVVTTVNGYRCDKCNAFNSDKDNYCPNCGAKMQEVSE